MNRTRLSIALLLVCTLTFLDSAFARPTITVTRITTAMLPIVAVQVPTPTPCVPSFAIGVREDLDIGASPKEIVATALKLDGTDEALDLDGDGKTDIVTRNLDDTVRVTLDVNGAALTQTLASGATDIIAGYIDADSTPDLVVLSSDASARVKIFEYDGASFQVISSLNPPLVPDLVAIGNFQGSDYNDLAINMTSTQTIFYNNNGSANFSLLGFVINHGVWPGFTPFSLSAGDLNNDGLSDVVLTGDWVDFGTTPKIRAYLRSGSAMTLNIDQFYDDSDETTIGDFNGDGTEDFVALRSSERKVQPYISLSQGSEFATGSSSRVVGLDNGDLDGDGFPDVVTANSSDQTISILLNTGALPSLFQSPMPYDTGAGSNVGGISIADVDGDGDPDILVANGNAIGGGVALFRNESVICP